MNDYEIPLSKRPVYGQSILSGLLVLAACVVTTMFFDRIVSAAHLQNILLTILWIGLPLLWLTGSLLAIKGWPKTTYVLTEHALQIRKKGWFGSYSEKLYRYESILTITSTNSSFGPYGTLALTLSQLDPLVIHSVLQPEKHARRIKELVAKGQPKIQTIPR